MILRKNYEEQNSELVSEIQKRFSLPFSLANYLIHLGYDTLDKVYNYLNPSKEQFCDPYLFRNMTQVVDRIKKAVELNEKIVIFGDYDADGIGATAILVKYFKSINVMVDYFLPSRYNDGYGLTIESVDKVKDLFNPSLIITVDCGISCVEEIDYIKSLGIDVIVTDHHEQGEILPNCLILDAKVNDEPYPFKFLCGAGVALKVVCALSGYEEAKKYMTICAISTIADIVELVDENRFIVTEGLKNFQEYCPVGLKYLFKKSKITNIPNATDISFRIAPKINATGRMGDATVALSLYLEENQNIISSIYQKIIEMNERRQEICQNILSSCEEEIQKYALYNRNILILKGENWESGILGIVCAKLIEKYQKPVILFGYDKRVNAYVGSARSITNIDIFEIIANCSELLVNFGGHKMAAGLTIKAENFDIFYNRIDVLLENFVFEKTIYKNYDIELKETEINIKYVDALDKLEPFGVGNPKPEFIMRTNYLNAYPMGNHKEHLLIKFKNYNGIYFNGYNSIYTLNTKCKKIIKFYPYLDSYLGRRQLKININDIYCDNIESFNKDVSMGSYFNENFYVSKLEKPVYFKYKDFHFREEGVLYITYSPYVKKGIECKYDIVDYVYLSHNTNINTLLVSPIEIPDLSLYSDVVFLDGMASNNIIKYINEKFPQIKVYIRGFLKDNDFFQISNDRSLFSKCYKIFEKNQTESYDKIAYFRQYFPKEKVNYCQFLFCLNVFKELGFLTEIFKNNLYKIQINNSIKKELSNSLYYKKYESGAIND